MGLINENGKRLSEEERRILKDELIQFFENERDEKIGAQMDEIDLSFTDGALDLIVEKAIDYKLGARGLRALCEEILNDAMFELPSSKEDKLNITKTYVEGKLSKSKLNKLKAVS